MSGAPSPSSLSSRAYALWQQVKSIFPTAIFTSGRRNYIPKGGSATSQHLDGDAFDFQVPGVSAKDVQASIIAAGLPFGQSITEYGLSVNPVNHLSVGTKGQVMTATNGNYRTLGYTSQGYAGQPGSVPVNATQAVGPAPGRQYLIDQYGPVAGNIIADSLSRFGHVLEVPGQALDQVPIIGTVKGVMEGAAEMSLDDWFKRGALLIFALIFIAAALFLFKGSDVINTVKGFAK